MQDGGRLQLIGAQFLWTQTTESQEKVNSMVQFKVRYQICVRIKDSLEMDKSK